MRNPKRNLSVDGQESKNDSRMAPIKKRRTSWVQRSSSSGTMKSTISKRKRTSRPERSSSSGSKKETTAIGKRTSGAQRSTSGLKKKTPVRKRNSRTRRSSNRGRKNTPIKKRTTHAQKSSSNSKQKPKVKENKKIVKKPLAKKDLDGSKKLQNRKQASVINVTNTVKDFVSFLYNKNMRLEKGTSFKSEKMRIIKRYKKGSTSDKGGNTEGNSTSTRVQGPKTVSSSITESDPIFKAIRDIMYT